MNHSFAKDYAELRLRFFSAEMVLFRLDRKHSACANVASVPLGRVSEALPGFMPPSVAGAYSMGAFLLILFASLSPWLPIKDHCVLCRKNV